MYRIEIIGISTDNFNVALYDHRNIIVDRAYMTHLNALQAYIYIRGLIAAYGAGIDSFSVSAWEYLMMMFRVDRSQN